MSERPTISIYLHDHAVDHGHYRNWDGLDLLVECCTLVGLLDGSRSWQEVKMRLEEGFRFEDSPEGFKESNDDSIDPQTAKLLAMSSTLDRRSGHYPDDEAIRILEYYSEYRIYIDLSRRVVYQADSLLEDAVKVVSWREWIKPREGWYSPWPEQGRAFSFDDANELLRWAGIDRSDGIAKASEYTQLFGLFAEIFESIDEVANSGDE